MRVIEAVVMAGGRGSRMGYVIKPLTRVCGRPMIYWVVSAAREAVGRVVVALSPVTAVPVSTYIGRTFGPEVGCVETPGAGYVKDLALILRCVRLPALILPSDTPAIRGWVLREFIRLASSLHPKPKVITLDSGSGPVGISLFISESGRWSTIRVRCEGLINVNTWDDVDAVERVMCGEGDAW